MTYRVVLSRQARRALVDDLPEAVAAACAEFVAGPLADAPHRVGRRLLPPLDGLRSARRGEYRILYRILDDVVMVHVVTIRHRRDAYRAP